MLPQSPWIPRFRLRFLAISSALVFAAYADANWLRDAAV